MRGEIRAIGDRLHANWVSSYGSNVERLTDTATEALRQGLRVSIQPRSFDEPQVVEEMRRTARDAERLRWRYEPEVILVIGCEFMLFTPGIVQDPPAVKDGYFRDEQEQADHLTNMLQVFGAEGLLGVSPYTFISPDAPHREERKYDEDIAAFSLMKVIQERSWDPASAYRWEPKKSFHAVSRFYRTH